MTYTMHIEKPTNVVKQWGYHLGTIHAIAESIIIERLRADPYILSIALRQNGKLIHIYDFRDIR